VSSDGKAHAHEKEENRRDPDRQGQPPKNDFLFGNMPRHLFFEHGIVVGRNASILPLSVAITRCLGKIAGLDILPQFLERALAQKFARGDLEMHHGFSEMRL